MDVNKERTLRLVPLSPSHYEALYALEFGPPYRGTVRHGGRSTSPDHYIASLWSGVEMAYVAESGTGEVEGLMSIYDFVPDHGTGKIAAILQPDRRRSLQSSFLLARFIELAFRSIPLRKLMIESISSHAEAFPRVLTGLFTTEGRLRAHVYHDGDYRDVVVAGLLRTEWAKSRVRARVAEGPSWSEPERARARTI